jgi:hypothetical protein
LLRGADDAPVALADTLHVVLPTPGCDAEAGESARLTGFDLPALAGIDLPA